MKINLKICLASLIIVIVSCSQGINKKNDTLIKPPVQAEATMLPVHTDDSKGYFAYILTKNDTIIKNIVSDQPVCLFGDKNIAIALDSSHHMLVNGDVVNIYLNKQTVKTYSILADANDSNAVTVLFSFTQKGEELPQIAFDSGKVTITKLIYNSCDGNFDARLKTQEGNVYFIKGEFQNAITNQ
jgi:hypothetical protein